MNPDEMDNDEKEFFPEYEKCEADYLDIRNNILFLWKRNPKQFLTFEETVKLVQDKFRNDVERIYDFLTRFGYINVGKFAGEEHKKTVSSSFGCFRCCSTRLTRNLPTHY
jgi:hypothetical protein